MIYKIIDINRIIKENKRKSIFEFLLLMLCIIVFIVLIMYDLQIIYISIMLIFIIFLIGLIVSNFSEVEQLKDCYRILKRNNEIEELNHVLFYSRHQYILTSKYIIKFSFANEIYNYFDIVLIYIKHVREKHGVNKNLNVIMKSGRKISFEIGSTMMCINSDTIDFSNIILEKNPNVLVGKTKKNKKILLEKYGIKI